MNVRIRSACILILATTCAAPLATGKNPPTGVKVGDKLHTIANLHPDMQRHVLYTLNYQLPGLIPVCSEVVVTQVHKKKLGFTYNGQEFEVGYEGFTEGAGVSFQDAVKAMYFGGACDHAKIQTLSRIDQDGIRSGQPRVGMTREGILFAMGRPPFHANPSLEADTWTYWKNRFAKTAIQFGPDGKVATIL